MYCIIYRFEIIGGQEDRFIKSWTDVTQAFNDHCGALGSRLHKNEKLEYIAYAQWPSKEKRDNADLPSEVKESAYAEMRSCCNDLEVLFELTPVSDLLIESD